MSLYADMLARRLERRAREATGECVSLLGRSYAEHAAALGCDADALHAEDFPARTLAFRRARMVAL